MNKFKSNFIDDFLEGSKTIYNYLPTTRHPFLFYAQLAGVQDIGKNYYNETEFSQEYMIQYTLEGQGRLNIFTEDITVEKGDLIFISNYHKRIFQPVPDKRWKFACIHIFPNDLVDSIYQKVFESHRWIMHDVDSKLIVPLIEKIIELLQTHSAGQEAMVSSNIYQLLMNIYALSVSDDVNVVDSEIYHVISYILENFASPIKLEDILKNTIYSKNHLERLFKARMKMTIRDYLNDLRLKKSQSLIIGTDMPFKEIARQVGLPDYRALVYMYRRSFNMKPSQYRENAKKSAKPSEINTFDPKKTIV